MPSAGGAMPPHYTHCYASPLHGMAYNERPHEWLLNDPDDKDAVQYVRHHVPGFGDLHNWHIHLLLLSRAVDRMECELEQRQPCA
jgi:hypothetical protein